MANGEFGLYLIAESVRQERERKRLLSPTPTYTLAELKLLMKEWLNGEDNIAGSEELLLDWHLSLFVEWLAKREQGKEGRDDT